MKNIIFILYLLLGLSSCAKEDIIPIESEPIPEKDIPLYVPAGRWSYYYGFGSGSGYKNGNKFYFTPATWELPQQKGRYAVFFNTYQAVPDSIFQREVIGGMLLPLEPSNGLPIRSEYLLLVDGGDFSSEDEYYLDTTKPHFLNIEVLNEAENIIKGSMEAHYNLRDTIMKENKKNPNHVHFTKMNFETKFRK